MKKEIPHIQFEHKNATGLGIEILTLESVKNRVSSLDHNPERAHQLTFNLLVYYTKGNGKHLIDFVWHDVVENTVVYLVKGQTHAFKFKEDLQGYLIAFTDEFLNEQFNNLPKNELIRLFNPHLFSPTIQVASAPRIRTYFDLFFNEFVSNKNEHIKNNISESLFTIIFAKLEELKQDQTEHIKPSKSLDTFLKFKELVVANFSRSRNADFYASQLNITYKHLNTICKEVTQSTAKSLIDDYIILEAKRRLINSSISSSELAFQLGFNEPTNFVKYFKKFTGLTPNMFKKDYN